MEAIRQTVKVKNHKISITLPEDFNAEEVDVIIMPSQNIDVSIPQWQINQVRERSAEYLKDPSITLDIDESLESILNKRSKEDKSTFISAEESITRLKNRKGV